MNLNDTIKTQLNHRSIRHFKNQQLDKETLNTLYEVANHTASSQFLQQFSIIHVTDKSERNSALKVPSFQAITAIFNHYCLETFRQCTSYDVVVI